MINFTRRSRRGDNGSGLASLYGTAGLAVTKFVPDRAGLSALPTAVSAYQLPDGPRYVWFAFNPMHRTAQVHVDQPIDELIGYLVQLSSRIASYRIFDQEVHAAEMPL